MNESIENSSAEQDLELAESLLNTIIRNYIQVGAIEIDQWKSYDDLIDEFKEIWYADEGPGCAHDSEGNVNRLYSSTDFTVELLLDIVRASSACSRLILAATWVEHWVNRMISDAMWRNELDRDGFYTIVRRFGAPIDKIRGLWPLLGFEPMDGELLRRIGQLSEWRNAHVHYKWTMRDMNVDDPLDTERRAGLGAELVWDIYRYEDSLIHAGRAAELYFDWPLELDGSPKPKFKGVQQ